MVEDREQRGAPAPAAEPAERALPVSRRRLLAGAASTVPLVPVLQRLLPGGRDNGPAGPRRQDGTGVEGTAVATPEASSAPDPAASPDAGGLRLVTDQRPTYPEAPDSGGTLRLALARPIASDFNPAALPHDFQVAASYLDPLVWVDEVTMEPRPWLAESWSWNDDGTEIAYELRRDVRWHDGTPLTADDVRFSFYVYRDDANSAVRNFFANMREAEVIDERRLVVRLRRPDGGWIFNASNQFVFQREQYRRHWGNQAAGVRSLSGFDWEERPPVGTGPWKLTGRRERRLTFDRNADYWAGPPHADALELNVFEDPEARLERWQSGFLDLLWLASPEEVEAVRREEGTLYIADAAEVMFAAFNFANPARPAPLFDDVRVRQALSLALDRERYAREVFRGFVQHERAGTIAQPWANDPAVVNPPRDLEAASRLLGEAGWLDRDGDGRREDADGTPLTLVAILRDDGRPELAQTLRHTGAALRDVGIDLDVQPLNPAAFRRRWAEDRDFDLIAFAYRLYAGFTDFDLYGSAWDIRTNPRGFNPGGYSNPTVDEAIEVAMTAIDIPTQRRALHDLQRAVNDDLFGLWFGFPQDLILVRPDVLGYQPNKMWQTWDTRKLWRRPE